PERPVAHALDLDVCQPAGELLRLDLHRALDDDRTQRGRRRLSERRKRNEQKYKHEGRSPKSEEVRSTKYEVGRSASYFVTSYFVTSDVVLQTPSYASHHSTRACRMTPSAFGRIDRKSTRLNSSHRTISYAVFC